MSTHVQPLYETKFPHIYAFAFVLSHGEICVPGLERFDLSDATFQKMEDTLAGMSFKDIVNYSKSQDTPTPPELLPVITFLKQNHVIPDWA